MDSLIISSSQVLQDSPQPIQVKPGPGNLHHILPNTVKDQKKSKSLSSVPNFLQSVQESSGKKIELQFSGALVSLNWNGPILIYLKASPRGDLTHPVNAAGKPLMSSQDRPFALSNLIEKVLQTFWQWANWTQTHLLLLHLLHFEPKWSLMIGLKLIWLSLKVN